MATDGVWPERVYVRHKSGPAGRKEKKACGALLIDLPIFSGNCGNRFFRHWRRTRGVRLRCRILVARGFMIAVWRGHRKSMPAKNCLQCPGYPFLHVAGG